MKLLIVLSCAAASLALPVANPLAKPVPAPIPQGATGGAHGTGGGGGGKGRGKSAGSNTGGQASGGTGSGSDRVLHANADHSPRELMIPKRRNGRVASRMDELSMQDHPTYSVTIPAITPLASSAF
ncbi:hypothetical protein EG327_002593 [Venturia inaequalis]|uniref:Uncharacterized protein n=1 Tax=Venturia inaequalis TaxID=5025 RepID=A0A8H3VL84_VENIN|nr:hypothetical protein EG327_002593 [Venturia inaequalis]